MDFSAQKLVFVTGKGGVGKSLTAASIAYKEAKKGRKVCLVELGAHSFYDSFFQTRGLGYEPQEIFKNFHVALLNPEEALREYITHYIRVSKLYDLLFENRVTKSFISAAPGANEISILGKLTSDIRKVGPQSDYDLYVVDCYSTGHALALLRAPRGIATAVRMGPLGEQSRDISQVLRMRDKVAYVVVTLAEEMPLREGLELTQTLRQEFSEEITLVCNRLLNPPVSLEEINSFEKKRVSAVDGVHDFVEFLQFKLNQQNEAHVLLKETGLPLYSVPLLTQSCEASWSPEIFLKTVSGHLENRWT